MSHSGMIPRAPDAQAIQRLGDDLAASSRDRRRHRSLQTCHRPAFRAPATPHRDSTQAYAPQFSARLLNDPNLSDGARRCALKLMELVYRRNRAGRGMACTVTYLARCLGRSDRAVQNYLAQLRAGGYIRHDVITSERARMCVGIFVTLLGPLFPKHHKAEWPIHAMKSGVKTDSQNYIQKHKYRESGGRMTVEEWAMRCMNGVYRALMKSNMVPAVAHQVF